ncbi:TadE/TadG family type IV pilus assembly protein [Acetobacter oeni]|uniref:TadE/TadG family type IV pilus assembly protein n=1 Tax=Acetobacter oeni TaxID=304077 RepID=UPI001888293F|nr:TadE/TadG family type IV pilus assembly protein [Acetobacter oeni]
MEFAFIALPLITLLYASVVMSIIYFTQDALDAVADQMSRLILTGQAPASTDSGAFKTLACARLPAYMSCSSLFINAQTVASFADVNTAVPTLTFDGSGVVSNSWSYDPGSPGDIVVLQMIYMLPIVAVLGGFNPVTESANQTRLIVSTVVIKNEPSS